MTDSDCKFWYNKPILVLFAHNLRGKNRLMMLFVDLFLCAPNEFIFHGKGRKLRFPWKAKPENWWILFLDMRATYDEPTCRQNPRLNRWRYLTLISTRMTRLMMTENTICWWCLQERNKWRESLYTRETSFSDYISSLSLPHSFSSPVFPDHPHRFSSSLSSMLTSLSWP